MKVLPNHDIITHYPVMPGGQEGFPTKLYNIDAQELDRLIQKAKGNVYLISDDNKLNLKSRLCRLYGIQKLLEGAKDSTVTAELSVDDPDDELMFLNYMMSK